MQYSQLSKYFESEEGIAVLLKDLEDTFNTIDDYVQQFMQDTIITSEELRTAKTTLTGIVAMLNPIYSKALSFKKQNEYRFYVQKKEQCEKDGTKFTDGSSTIEAKDSVRTLRGVRDIIFGYIKSAESLIYDCKDRLIQCSVEYKNTKDQ